jgi:type III restriction enzyme
MKMLKTLEYQSKAVDELVEKTFDLLNEDGNRKKLVFKAPTGSGKTVMASEMLSRIFTEIGERSDCKNHNIAFIWIAPNKLHEQSYFKMKNYFTETRILSPVMYDELDHSIDGYIKPGEIFFVNWESINKDNAVMIRDSELCASLYDICRRTQEDNNTPIIVIIDEEHMFGGRLAKKSENVLKTINPKLEIRISATPITNGDQMVNISREKVIHEEMIKEGIILNPAIDAANDGLTLNQRLTKLAIKKREEIAEAYKKLGVNINPLLLIQLPNDTSENLSSEEQTIADGVTNYLDTMCNINVNNGKLAIWLSGKKENLDGIEKNDNLTEALLFKQAIALGWDCPRAAVLLIFRKLDSVQFSVQTVGRILRMPEQKFYTDDLLNKGYVYTDLSKEQIQIVADDMNYITTLHSLRRNEFHNVSLPSQYQIYTVEQRNRLGSDFKEFLKKTMAELWSLEVQPSLFATSIFLDEDSNKEEEKETHGKESDFKLNRSRAEKSGIHFDVKNITVEIPKDVFIEGDETGIIDIEGRSVKIAKTHDEVDRVYQSFCRSKLTAFEKVHSTPILSGALLGALEDVFEIFETDAKKVVLYYLNKPKFADLLEKTLSRYAKKVDERRTEAKKKGYVEYQWEVPEDRFYNEATNVVVTTVKNHALMPFVREQQASLPERNFEAFLEANTQFIDWWYKNGDDGKQHFAIKYEKSDGNPGLFYVDFIIRMKNGQIFLFDTKSEASDSEAPNKHNALIDYINSEENKEMNLKGGVIVFHNDNWMYSKFKIENTNEVTNWDCFYPEQYNE